MVGEMYTHTHTHTDAMGTTSLSVMNYIMINYFLIIIDLQRTAFPHKFGSPALASNTVAFLVVSLSNHSRYSILKLILMDVYRV